MPWLERFEQSIIKDVLLEDEQDEFFPKFNVEGLLRGDYKSRMEGYSIARANGWLSTNDIRQLENLGPVSEEEGGDFLIVNGSYIKLKDVGRQYGVDEELKEESEAQDNKRRKRRK